MRHLPLLLVAACASTTSTIPTGGPRGLRDRALGNTGTALAFGQYPVGAETGGCFAAAWGGEVENFLEKLNPCSCLIRSVRI